MKGESLFVEKQEAIISFEDLQPGKYAVAAYHDINNNEKLDRNFVGIPKEPYGFSGKKGFGTPNFSRAQFTFGETDKSLIIKMK